MHQKQLVSKQWIFYGFACFASLLYLFLTFLAPQTTDTSFNLTQWQILLLKVTIALPYITTWIFAAYGLSTLERYISAAKREDTTIILLLRSVLSGLLWIVLSTILVAVIGGIRAYFMTDTAILPFFTIITNYLYIFPTLIGFILIYHGVSKLKSSQEMSEEPKQGNYLFNTFIVLLISSFYIFLIYTNPTRQFSTDPIIPPTYYLPDGLILLTIILPIIATWWFGFSAAFTLSDLVPHLTREELFKGITRILYGIWSIIFTSILIQALVSLGGTRLYSIGLVGLLLLIYIFIILQGLGYFFIAIGSNDLKKSLKEHAHA